MQIVLATTQNWKCIQEENELEWELQSKELSFPYERKKLFSCFSDRDKGKKDEEFSLKNQTRHKPQKISLNPPTLKCYIFIMPPGIIYPKLFIIIYN